MPAADLTCTARALDRLDYHRARSDLAVVAGTREDLTAALADIVAAKLELGIAFATDTAERNDYETARRLAERDIEFVRHAVRHFVARTR